MWKYDIDNKAAAVCQESSIGIIKNDCPRYKEEGLDPDSPYFNNGLMIINLDYWRRQRISKKIIKYLKDYPEACKFHEQSAMNVILYNKFKLLNQNWNVQSNNFKSYENFQKLYNYKINYHFTTSFKPWLYYYDSPPNRLFYALLEEVNYRIYNPEFIKRKKIYKQKQRFILILPLLYFLRSRIKKIFNIGFQSDIKTAEFWTEQIAISKFHKFISKQIDHMELRWRKKIRKSFKNNMTNYN